MARRFIRILDQGVYTKQKSISRPNTKPPRFEAASLKEHAEFHIPPIIPCVQSSTIVVLVRITSMSLDLLLTTRAITGSDTPFARG